MTVAAKPAPPGECPQCWAHAHDKSIHKALKGEQCQPCLDHMNNGHPVLVPKKPSSWW
ncbi:pRL2-8 [Streptomyces venezuelae]|uniref:PRL2-8 n=1 Tax=Streptomyces venezuelae TaxID=54571 RepID=A0A5P2CVN1_STRVZ|nr:pRL2-8 [Streptomyces venezuelae]QES46057.1 pRL2-8 [Streptomyces venezuelae]